MAFHEVLYPARLSYGSTGGPERRTEIVTLANGFEERNSPWAHSRRRYDAGGGLRSLDDVAVLVAFFEARMGRLHGFRWKDWADYKSCPPSAAISATDQQIGVGDGVERSFRLTKRYASAGSAYLRPIAKPVAGSLRIALEGGEVTAWEADPESGVVTFATPPARGVSITAGYEFDVPVRFDTDQIRTSVATFQAGEVPDVPVVELRL
ncbi:DUF2460 domain-containing protein [Haematobacter sp.]|uniref:DUF2460 domain-containing protein n=1 Tax=Haematobacter sp. TaxID=2953762 RepID=UPI0028A5DD66|nr:DUF2460 domain-containing protein [Haematobacter sp.]